MSSRVPWTMQPPKVVAYLVPEGIWQEVHAILNSLAKRPCICFQRGECHSCKAKSLLQQYEMYERNQQG